ncbi:MAG TPA: sulfatase-like hydrolase/transferase [Thermoanaerobaculia bacterium]|nr:sulfatase-like hydrolase/transferase [Thermoanaerobaculia bacterium]
MPKLLNLSVAIAITFTTTIPVRADSFSRLILVIVVDTLRADHLRSYGYGRDTTPELDRIWRSGSTLYTQSYSAAAFTQPSVSSILTGLRPASHGYYGFQRDGLPKLPVSIPQYLHSKGYYTALANANPNTPWTFPAFDVVWSDQMPKSYYPSARVIAEARKQVAAAKDRDLFLYLQLTDTHMPYDPPVYDPAFFVGDPIGKHFQPQFDGIRVDHVKEITPPVLRNMINRYDAALHYLDSQLAPFIEELRRQFSEHLIIFTADHGEAFLEHGEAGHGSAMYNTEIRVPLIIIDSTHPRTGLLTSGALANGVDLFPTIIERLGDDPSKYHLTGRSILWTLTSTAPRNESRMALSESPYFNDDRYTGFGRCWGMAYFHQPNWGEERGTVVKLSSVGPNCASLRSSVAHHDQWFDLVKDRQENSRLRPRQARASLLNPQFVQAWSPPPIMGVKTSPLSPEEIEKLKALGYLNTGQ